MVGLSHLVHTGIVLLLLHVSVGRTDGCVRMDVGRLAQDPCPALSAWAKREQPTPECKGPGWGRARIKQLSFAASRAPTSACAKYVSSGQQEVCMFVEVRLFLFCNPNGTWHGEAYVG